MTRKELVELIRQKQSFLCVGLDTDPAKLPEHLRSHPDGMYVFNRQIIEATLPFAAAYKINTAFYEAQGAKGWDIMERTIDLIPERDAFIIADAKRGDIGNTTQQYAKAFFRQLNCHAITVNPYMGVDTVQPFLEFEERWAIALGLTSNPGAQDVEMLVTEDGRPVYELVIEKLAANASAEQLMFVIGATKEEQFSRIREIAPEHFLLVPGVGAQGGSLESLQPLMNKDVGILVNSSRKIIYAGSGEDFADDAAREAQTLQQAMQAML